MYFVISESNDSFFYHLAERLNMLTCDRSLVLYYGVLVHRQGTATDGALDGLLHWFRR
jgi:hypothetical protein